MGWDGTGNRTKPGNWDRLRRTIAKRDGYCCKECNKEIDLKNGRCDHIIAWADGGNDYEDNLQWLCVQCHQRKTRAELQARNYRSKPAHPGYK